MEVADHLAGTFLAGAPIVPVAATSGRRDRRPGRARSAGLARSTPAAGDRGRPRLWIDRVFAAKGSGTVVTGTLTDGSVATGDHVVVEPGGRPARVRAIQTLGRVVDGIGPGNRVALNLAGIDHAALARGDAVVTPGRWRPTRRFDASLTVLATLDHVVSRRGAYLAYIGSGEHAVRLRVLGPSRVAPGATGAVRLHLPAALPLLPGDRYVLRETGRDETVGGGEVLDVAPVLPASRARPDRRVERVVAERGWVDADELEALTGERLAPTVGRWVVDPAAAAAAAVELRERLAGGVELAELTDRQRAVLDTVDDVVVDGTRARLRGAADPLADHPVIAALAVRRAGARRARRPAVRPARAGQARRAVRARRAVVARRRHRHGVGRRRRPADRRRRRVHGQRVPRRRRRSPASTPCRCSPSSTPVASPAGATTGASPARGLRPTDRGGAARPG